MSPELDTSNVAPGHWNRNQWVTYWHGLCISRKHTQARIPAMTQAMTLKPALLFVFLAACNLPMPDAKDTGDTGDTEDTGEEQTALPDPALWLNFDDDPGWLVDSTGQVDVTIGDGTPQPVEGLSGGGIEFRSNRADELSINDVEIPSDCAWTLTTWFKVSDTEDWGQTRVLLGAEADMQHLAVDQNYLVINGPGGPRPTNVNFTTLSTGWHHLGVVTDCDGMTTIALNGTLKTTLSAAVRLPITRIGNSGYGEDDWLESWGTVLDDLRIYDEAIDIEQIEQIMQDL